MVEKEDTKLSLYESSKSKKITAQLTVARGDRELLLHEGVVTGILASYQSHDDAFSQGNRMLKFAAPPPSEKKFRGLLCKIHLN